MSSFKLKFKKIISTQERTTIVLTAEQIKKILCEICFPEEKNISCDFIVNRDEELERCLLTRLKKSKEETEGTILDE